MIVIAILLVAAFLLSAAASCSVILQGGVSAFGSSSFTADDTDMLAAEARYCALETELKEYIDSYERTHDYDEYHYDLDNIHHDPYVLISAISALHVVPPQSAEVFRDDKVDLPALNGSQHPL